MPLPKLPIFDRFVVWSGKLFISVIFVVFCFSSLFFSEHKYSVLLKTVVADVNPEHRPLLLIGFPRTLWASGFHARSQPERDFSQNGECGVWTWTVETETIFASHYHKTMFEGICNSSRIIGMGNANWGHASRLRDVGSFLLEGVLSNRRVVHLGLQACPQNPEADPTLWCQFSRMSSCEDSNVRKGGGPVNIHFDNVGWFTGAQPNRHFRTYKPGAELWQKLVQNGLQNIVRNDTQCDRRLASMDSGGRRLGILRSLLLATSVLPADELQSQIDALGKRASPPAGAMLVLHLRRTDKRNDGVKLLKHERESNPIESIVVVQKLIKIAERLSGETFTSIFVMSDDPEYYSAKVSKAFSSAASQSPPVFFDDSVPKYLESVLPQNNSYRTKGHASLPIQHRDWLTRQMFAGVYFAGNRGAFIIGNGKSGVTQLVAQLIGAKRKVDPNVVALFEDDPVQLMAFNETRNFAT